MLTTCPDHPTIKMVTFCPACRGAIRSSKKSAASRENGKLGGQTNMSNRFCSQCHTARLRAINKSGVCRECTRHPGRTHRK